MSNEEARIVIRAMAGIMIAKNGGGINTLFEDLIVDEAMEKFTNNGYLYANQIREIVDKYRPPFDEKKIDWD